jgi:uncharacterized membrane protein
MKEASLAKYYFAKYFFLAFGLLQWVIALIFWMKQGDTFKGQYAVFIFFTLGLLLMSVHILFASNLKRVAVSKKKLTVTSHGKTKSYEWDEIKAVKFLPVFNLYEMKIKGKKGIVYFLPTEESEVIYGLFPSAVGITKKGK